MPDGNYESGVVSWKIFNDLYESQYDLFRKMRFFIKSGKSAKNEKLALEMIEDFIARKEGELEKIRQEGLNEWAAAGRETSLVPVNQKNLPARITAGPLVGPNSAARGTDSLWGKLKAIVGGK